MVAAAEVAGRVDALLVEFPLSSLVGRHVADQEVAGDRPGGPVEEDVGSSIQNLNFTPAEMSTASPDASAT